MANLLEIIYFTAPAWFSNTLAAVFCYFFIKKGKIIPTWPVDFGLKINGKRLFGDQKTVLGCFITLISASLIGLIQNQLLIGVIMGFSVIIGTLLNSFVKRRCNIIDGGNFFPFDQIDYALSTLLILNIFQITPVFFNSAIFLIFIFIYQLLINFAAFKLRFIKSFLWWMREQQNQ
ncbi:MAG: CDP-archaeol synthase [Patescibacteria group bacterium]|nr:CDP-archaeol synthase [Patescibacteria group bacterium]